MFEMMRYTFTCLAHRFYPLDERGATKVAPLYIIFLKSFPSVRLKDSKASSYPLTPSKPRQGFSWRFPPYLQMAD